MNAKLLCLSLPSFLLLSVCHAVPAYAKVLPAIWDGKCTPIHMATNVKHNPEDEFFEKGFIPKGFEGEISDISTCIPSKPEPAPPAGGPK
jgi:hypothetical protein